MWSRLAGSPCSRPPVPSWPFEPIVPWRMNRSRWMYQCQSVQASRAGLSFPNRQMWTSPVAMGTHHLLPAGLSLTRANGLNGWATLHLSWMGGQFMEGCFTSCGCGTPFFHQAKCCIPNTWYIESCRFFAASNSLPFAQNSECYTDHA